MTGRNLAVVLVSAVCGWHPAVWWITRELVQERELACDDWVIRHGGAPQPYLRGLAKVAVLAARPAATELAPGAGATRGQLLRRVTRVLRRAPGSAWRVSRAAGLVAGGFLAASVFWMTGLAPLITFEADDAPAAKLAASRPLLDSTSPDGVDVTLLADVAPGDAGRLVAPAAAGPYGVRRSGRCVIGVVRGSRGIRPVVSGSDCGTLGRVDAGRAAGAGTAGGSAPALTRDRRGASPPPSTSRRGRC